MSVQPAPEKKFPWLYIAIGAVAVLCLCTVVIGVASFALFFPLSSSNIVTEEPIVTAEPAVVEATPEPMEPTTVPGQGDENPLFAQAAPVGSAVEIGNNMTLSVLDVTRPADEIVANGSSFNTTAAEGEEFIQVEVQVTCTKEAETPCSFYPTVIKVVLADGSTRDLQTFIEGVDDWDTSIEVEGGETEQGVLLFIVPKSETQLVLRYQDIYAEQPLYLQLP